MKGYDDDVVDEKSQRFLNWLQLHGATFPKISWPSNATTSGIRGAVALENINPFENMIQIPIHLMITPPVVYQEPTIGNILKNSHDFVQGDVLLTIFMMYEKRKEKQSMYFDYFEIIPKPDNISEWSMKQLEHLQAIIYKLFALSMFDDFSKDTMLISKAISRKNFIRISYRRSVLKLSELYPDVFPLEQFPLELFNFFWNNIQARAFGRRLPWTSMVPFADCLNHNNVQTKYDYNVNGNGLFRLFPSGTNHYPIGMEVFNSYGRRGNDNLLMDYGFAMLDNDWDEVSISLKLHQDDNDEDDVDQKDKNLKRNVLFFLGIHSQKLFLINCQKYPLEILICLRVLCSSVGDIERMELLMDNLAGSIQSVDDHLVDEIQKDDVDGDGGEEGGYFPDQLDEGNALDQEMGKESDKVEEIINDIPKQSLRQMRQQIYSSRLNISNELECLDELQSILWTKLNEMPTGLEDDIQQLDTGLTWKEDQTDEDKTRWHNAVKYRITQKKIIIENIRKLKLVENYLQRHALKEVNEDNGSMIDRVELLKGLGIDQLAGGDNEELMDKIYGRKMISYVDHLQELI